MAKEIKAIGSNIDLKGIVVHQVIKDAGTRKAKAKKATTVLGIGEKEKKFIGKVDKAYYQKSKPTYGIFGNENPIFKDLLNEYLKVKNFYSFSVNALNHYRVTLENSIPATGGFLIFAHFYKLDIKNDYMLVLTINNKDGYVVKETDLTIEDIKNLDLSKVDMACMINLTKWNDIELGEDKDSKTYLSFIKGIKNVSYYFMSFIDCDNKTTSSESTYRLTNALDAYCNEMGYDRDTKIKKRNEVFQYCEDCLIHKKEIQLSAISALLDNENPDSFEIFASDEHYGVSVIISGDRSKLRSMKYVKYKDKKMTIEFDCNLLNREVFYNAKRNELTIKSLPQELIDQIPK